MNRFRYLSAAFVALAACTQIARAQLPADHDLGHNQSAANGGVESLGGRLFQRRYGR
jgi:hypothetical protein